MKNRVAIGLLALWLGAGAVLYWVTDAFPQAQPYPQQCVMNALAGGTPNAITTPALPCALTTNLLLLTAIGTNTGGVTIQPLGLPAQTVLRPNLQPLAAGDITGAGFVAMLTPTGSYWILLNPATVGLGSLPASDVGFTTAGGPLVTIDLQTRGAFQSFAGDYGASGSAATTTANTQMSSDQITLASAGDFTLGEGVLVQYAGAAASTTAPTFSVTPEGATGSTHYCYDISSVDSLGGYTAPTQHCIVNGNATLTAANYNLLTITVPGTAKGVLIWESANAGGPWTYMGSSDGNYSDTGYAALVRPWWIASGTPVAKNDWLVATISHIAGTVATLSSPAGSTQTGVYVQHDDTAAINFGLQSVGPAGLFGVTQLLLPCGTYNISSPIAVTSNSTSLLGSGQCSIVAGTGVLNDISIIGSSGTPYAGDYVENFYINDAAKALGLGMVTNWANGLLVRDLTFAGTYSGLQFKDYNNIHLDNVNVSSMFGEDGVGIAFLSDSTHISKYGDVSGAILIGNGGVNGNAGLSQIGVEIDGNVQNTTGRRVITLNTDGAGLQISNVVANAAAPNLVNLVNFQSIVSNGPGVDLLAGGNVSFLDSTTTASNYMNYVSCTASAGFSVASGVVNWAWTGGLIATSTGDGVYVNSTQGVLRPNQVLWNSDQANGGTTGACPGVEFGGSSEYVTLTGAQIGDQVNPSWQLYAVLLDSGATYVGVTDNVFAGNATDTIHDSSGVTTNQIAPNVHDTARVPLNCPSGVTAGTVVAIKGIITHC